MIVLGPIGSETRIANEKMIKRDIDIGLFIAKKSRYLVSYDEAFEWMGYFCIKMEYCRLGDLQQQFDSGRVFTEKAYLIPLFSYYFLGNYSVRIRNGSGPYGATGAQSLPP
jgi:hypothetical protein